LNINLQNFIWLEKRVDDNGVLNFNFGIVLAETVDFWLAVRNCDFHKKRIRVQRAEKLVNIKIGLF